MFSLLIVAKKSDSVTVLCSELVGSGYSCLIIPDGSDVIEEVAEQAPNLVLVEIDNQMMAEELIRTIKQAKPVSVIALVRREMLDSVDGNQDIADFLVEPYDVTELLLRMKRLTNIPVPGNSSELIRCDELVIDLATCEVFIGGRLVVLTFREYELLRFLAINRGRVFSREALLNQVWGYDYYGGDRTVDVHIRRLRSKIEEYGLSFIDTVRNIGYRFK